MFFFELLWRKILQRLMNSFSIVERFDVFEDACFDILDSLKRLKLCPLVLQ